MSDFVRRLDRIIASKWWYVVVIVAVAGFGLYVANQRLPQALERKAAMERQWAETGREAAEECNASPGCNGAKLEDVVEPSVLLAQATNGQAAEASPAPRTSNWFMSRGKLTPAGVATAFSAVVSIIFFAWLFTAIASRQQRD